MIRIERIGMATLYCGLCEEIAPSLSSIAAVVTDGPYGKREDTKRGSRGRHDTSTTRLHGKGSPARDWPPVHGDDKPFDPTPWLKYPKVVLCGANYFSSRLPDSEKWIVWDKREETTRDDNADCELIWTNLKGAARIHRQLWRGICRRGEEAVSPAQPRLHPTQKPVALMDFCIEICRLKPGQTVLDPYMGSGATGVAAVRRGLAFVGIEYVEEYFETSLRRISEAVRQPNMFAPHPAPDQRQPETKP